jgi:hypothetical protein
MSLKSKFGNKFETNQESFKANDPRTKRDADRITYLDKELTIYKPEETAPNSRETIQNRFRMIPHPDLGYFAYEVKVHFEVGPNKASTCCPRMKGEPCKICDTVDSLYKSGLKAQAKKLRPANYNLIFGVDRLNPDKGVQVWPVSGIKTIEAIRALMKDPENGAIMPIDDIDEGYDLFFWKGKVNGSDYSTINEITIGRKPTPLSKDEDEAIGWLNFVEEHPITKAVRFLSSEEIDALFNGAEVGEEDGEDDDAAPSRNSVTAAKTTAKTSAPDDDDELPAPKAEAKQETKPEPKEEPKQTESTTEKVSSISAKLAALKANKK